MSFPISEGNWKVGKNKSEVVTDQTPSWYKGATGHDDKDYYGGFLIAESIASQSDAKLIAASKRLFECVNRLLPHARTIINDNHPDYKFVQSVVNELK